MYLITIPRSNGTTQRVTRLAKGAAVRIDYSKMVDEDDDDVKENKRATKPQRKKSYAKPKPAKKSAYELWKDNNVKERNLIFEKFREQSKMVCTGQICNSSLTRCSKFFCHF